MNKWTYDGLNVVPDFDTRRGVAGGTVIDIRIDDARSTITRATVNAERLVRTNSFDGVRDSTLISMYVHDKDQDAYAELIRRGQAIETEFVAAVKRDEQARPLLAPVLGVLLALAFLAGCGKSRTWRTDEPQRCSNGQCHAPIIEEPAAEVQELQQPR